MVSFSNFHRLDPAARDVTIELLAKADGQPPSFIAFIYRWMAFNGWMSAVTLGDSDREMIDALAAAPRLASAFDQLMAGDAAFAEAVTAFAAMWPVLNVKSVRAKLGYAAFNQHDRPALLALCAANNVRQQPQVWMAGSVPTWEQLLRTIYQVRCNLFHGEKSTQAYRDHELVTGSDKILARFIAGTGCFDWYDL
jgi:hypothetical protein